MSAETLLNSTRYSTMNSGAIVHWNESILAKWKGQWLSSTVAEKQHAVTSSSKNSGEVSTVDRPTWNSLVDYFGSPAFWHTTSSNLTSNEYCFRLEVDRAHLVR